MNHKDKLKLARKLHPPHKNRRSFRGYTNDSIFSSLAWLKRKAGIELRVEFQEEQSKQHSIRKNLI